MNNKKQESGSSSLVRTAFFFTGLFVASVAQASPIRWTLTNVTFEDTSSAIGSFVYDSATDSYTDIVIVSDLAIHSFELEPSPFTSISFVSNSSPDVFDPFISFKLASSLTDAGGVIPIVLTPGGIGSHEGLCGGPDCAPRSVERYIASGSLVGTAAPVPAAGWLLVSALGLLGWMRRKAA